MAAETTYNDFVQRVRRHRPSDLLIALAANAVQLFEQEAWIADRVRFPWALAAAAKASIVAGNEHRRAGVTNADVAKICAAYNALDSSLRPDPAGTSETVGAFFVRTSFEQFRYQQSHFEEIARLGALFANLEDLELEILDHALIERILGCSLEEFTVAGFVAATGARVNAGFFDPDWPALIEALDGLFPISTVKRVFEEQFLAGFAQIRDEAQKWKQSDVRLRHHEYNPLVGRPFVTLPDGRHIAPQPHLAFQRLSPSTLYYAGVAALNKDDADRFTRDTGVVFQDYVGRQLRQIRGALVLPEIYYDDDQRSVDWFVIFDALVVLVEAKATRMTHLGRMGAHNLQKDLDRCVGEAYGQVARTNQLLNDRHPTFAEIPPDRPRVAIIGTLEPYWAANSPLLREFLPEPVLPTSVASVREIERLVDVLDTTGGDPKPLIAVFADPDRRTWNLGQALPDIGPARNPILDAAWERYPFPGKTPRDSAQ